MAKPNIEVDKLLHTSERYKSLFSELSLLYDRIWELSLDFTPPPKVVEVFDRINSDGCKISAEFGSLIREISSKETLVKSDWIKKSFFDKFDRAQMEQTETIKKVVFSVICW